MEAIWKYRLDVIGIQKIKMQASAKILCVQTQYEIPCIWAQIYDIADEINVVERTFLIVGTGHTYDKIPKDYIGTFQLYGGGTVFHLFEIFGG